MKLSDVTSRVLEWIDKIAPGRKPIDTTIKLVAETAELLDAVANKDQDAVAEELADCLICMVDIANMYDINLISVALRKMEVNRQRQWKMEDGVLRRIR